MNQMIRTPLPFWAQGEKGPQGSRACTTSMYYRCHWPRFDPFAAEHAKRSSGAVQTAGANSEAALADEGLLAAPVGYAAWLTNC